MNLVNVMKETKKVWKMKIIEGLPQMKCSRKLLSEELTFKL